MILTKQADSMTLKLSSAIYYLLSTVKTKKVEKSVYNKEIHQ